MRFRDKREEERKAAARRREELEREMRELGSSGDPKDNPDDPINGRYLSMLDRIDPAAARAKCIVISVLKIAQIGSGMCMMHLAEHGGITEAMLTDYFAGNVQLTEDVEERLAHALPIEFEGDLTRWARADHPGINICVGAPPPREMWARRRSQRKSWAPFTAGEINIYIKDMQSPGSHGFHHLN